MPDSPSDILPTLIYQPYYHRPGHFKYMFDDYRKFFTEHGHKPFCIVGLRESEQKLTSDTRIYTFPNTYQSKPGQILANLRGLGCLSKVLHKHPEIENIHFLDIEVTLLSLYFFLRSRIFRDKRIVITQHSINHYFGKKGFLARLYQFLAKWAFRYLDNKFDLRVITNGQFIADSLADHHFVSRSHLIISSMGSKPADRQIEIEDKNERTFLFFGIIRKDKNLEYLLDSFQSIEDNYNLIIAGYPADYSEEQVYQLIDYYQIPHENLELHLDYVSVERMKQLFTRSQFIILPYSPENRSNSGPLTESIQYECIPIVSNYGERGQIVNQYNLGLTFNFDQNGLQHVIRQIIEDSTLTDNYRKRIKKQKKKFTWPYLIQKNIRDGAYR